jgi:anaerobic magnesium-protoporphyrin IX monomethyl ester cyclase
MDLDGFSGLAQTLAERITKAMDFTRPQSQKGRKRKMSVMLFVPPGGYFAERWSQGRMMPSLGILYLAAVLEKHGRDVEVIPSHVLGLSWNDISRKIEKQRPDIVGITTTTENRFLSFKLAKIAKKAYPPTFVVLGGPHCTTTAYDTLSHIPEVDGVISGEGEQTIVELTQALESDRHLKKVRGLSFRHNGNIIQNPPRMFIKDLNSLPFPARHLEPWDQYNFTMEVPGKGLVRAANMMTSRGCPFTCTFCATPTNWGRVVRGLTPMNVIKETEHLIEHYNARAIWFYDDTFNYNPQRTAKICDLILERKLDINWYCEIRADIITKELLAKMAEAGLFYTGFGIESGSDRICKDIITKRMTLEKSFRVIDWCHEFGIIPNPFFIFSHPTETWSEAQKTIGIIESLNHKTEISASLLHIYPGTQLEQRAREEGVIPEDFSWARERDRRVILLSAAQGHVPLYVDKLSWWQISDLLIRFSSTTKKVSIGKKAFKALGGIYSLNDLKRYLILSAVYTKYKMQQVFDILRNKSIAS